LEFDHEAHHEDAMEAIEVIRRGSTLFRLLGTFPRWNVLGNGA
jgi:hypothetical protein